MQYHGVDVSEHMITESAAAFGSDARYHFSLAKAEDLPFRNDSFDCVLCLGAFEYFPDGRRAVSELARVARPGGTIIVSMHNPFSPYRLWSRYGAGIMHRAAGRFRRLFRGHGHGRHGPRGGRVFRVYREKSIRDLLESGGVRVEDVVYYDFNLFLEPLDRIMPAASVRISEALESLGRGSLRFLGSGFIARGRKT
jgi:ubiquinone/menaquinone biosynthesis C-methylase UbiE